MNLAFRVAVEFSNILLLLQNYLFYYYYYMFLLMAGREKKSGRCCACAMNGSCKRCSCSVNKVPCTGCVPSKYGRCSNSCQLKVQAPVGSAVERKFVQGNENSQTGDSNDGQWQDKFVNAYGGKLLGSGGEISLKKWHVWCRGAVGFIVWQSL